MKFAFRAFSNNPRRNKNGDLNGDFSKAFRKASVEVSDVERMSRLSEPEELARERNKEIVDAYYKLFGKGSDHMSSIALAVGVHPAARTAIYCAIREAIGGANAQVSVTSVSLLAVPPGPEAGWHAPLVAPPPKSLCQVKPSDATYHQDLQRMGAFAEQSLLRFQNRLLHERGRAPVATPIWEVPDLGGARGMNQARFLHGAIAFFHHLLDSTTMQSAQHSYNLAVQDVKESRKDLSRAWPLPAIVERLRKLEEMLGVDLLLHQVACGYQLALLLQAVQEGIFPTGRLDAPALKPLADPQTGKVVSYRVTDQKLVRTGAKENDGGYSDASEAEQELLIHDVEANSVEEAYAQLCLMAFSLLFVGYDQTKNGEVMVSPLPVFMFLQTANNCRAAFKGEGALHRYKTFQERTLKNLADTVNKDGETYDSAFRTARKEMVKRLRDVTDGTVLYGTGGDATSGGILRKSQKNSVTIDTGAKSSAGDSQNGELEKAKAKAEDLGSQVAKLREQLKDKNKEKNTLEQSLSETKKELNFARHRDRSHSREPSYENRERKRYREDSRERSRGARDSRERSRR